MAQIFLSSETPVAAEVPSSWAFSLNFQYVSLSFAISNLLPFCASLKDSVCILARKKASSYAVDTCSFSCSRGRVSSQHMYLGAPGCPGNLLICSSHLASTEITPEAPLTPHCHLTAVSLVYSCRLYLGGSPSIPWFSTQRALYIKKSWGNISNIVARVRLLRSLP